jgi:pimeloyl-ACP methyl ester carboxylesterase
MVAKRRSAWIDFDWREHQRWVVVDERAVNYVELGSGPPLVFVHGLSGRWANWLENIPEFARDHRVLALDLPGFGHSPLPREEITISGYGRLLGRFLDAVGVDRAALVGNSMGGFIAAEVAITAPERVDRLVLVSAAGLSTEHRRHEPVLKGLYATEAVAQWVIARLVGRSEEMVGRPRGRQAAMWFVSPRAEELAPELILEQSYGAGKPGFLPALDALTDYPIRDRLAEIKAPTLIVWGEKDLLVPVRDAYEFHELIPESQLIIYPDVGHVAMLEVPERFNADLRAFLSDRRERLAAPVAPRAAVPQGS